MARRNALNLVLLIGGYGLGQGSIFLVQTWLVAEGDLELLALFGTHFSFAMLGIIVVEAGSLTILARHTVQTVNAGAAENEIWQRFWNTSAFRAMLAALVLVVIALYILTADAGEFSRHYLIFAAPAFLFWSVNGAGILDGLKLSGISGISGSIAYASSAVALIIAARLPIAEAGIVLGAAFTLGYVLTVALQALALARASFFPRFCRPDWSGIVKVAGDGLPMLGSTLPVQISFRAQLFIAAMWMGIEATAILVYVKQIVAAFSQLINFVRRVEFPRLVQLLSTPRPGMVPVVLKAQMLGNILSIGLALFVSAAGLYLLYDTDPTNDHLGFAILAFSPLVLLSGIAMGLSQGLAAVGNYVGLLIRSLVTMTVCIVLSYFLGVWYGVPGIALADSISTLISIFLSFALLQRISAKAGHD